jgi:hypothetical protein
MKKITVLKVSPVVFANLERQLGPNVDYVNHDDSFTNIGLQLAPTIVIVPSLDAILQENGETT